MESEEIISAAGSLENNEPPQYIENEEHPSDAKPSVPTIDNSSLSYVNRKLSVRLNDEDTRRNKLQSSYNYLAKRYSGIRNLEGNYQQVLQTIVNKVFPNRITISAYVRNLTFVSNRGVTIPVIAIRPENFPNSFIREILPEGMSLIFKGHIYRATFVIDQIYDTADTEKLDFEIKASFMSDKSVLLIRENNFLKEILTDAESLTEYTGKRLEEWTDYLNWRLEIRRRQIHGIKYYKLDYDYEKKCLFIWLVCPNKEYFDERRKFLTRDMQLFDNNYSENPWEFSFNTDTIQNGKGKKTLSKSIELGRYLRKFSDEYYLERSETNGEAEPETSKDEKLRDLNGDINGDLDDNIDSDFDADMDEEDEIIAANDILDKEITDDELFEHFKTPYIVRAAYALPQSDLDKIAKQNFENPNSEENYIRNYIVDKYYKNGFLATSAVGDFVLINRFKRATRQFENNEYWSPNLAVWLFDITKARLPEPQQSVEITDWLNDGIAGNENQRIAVQKMLDAPDVCLIQGPPGTGKTTVIAEAVYQMVKRGSRVLIASQSNDAVDNALERLAASPIIRAVRIGQKNSRRNRDENAKSGEKEALKAYYDSVSAFIKGEWLNVWEEIERRDTELLNDKRDASNFREDILEYRDLLARLTNEENLNRGEADAWRRRLEEACSANERLLAEQTQFRFFREKIAGNEGGEFFLSERALRIAENTLSPIIDEAAGVGVMLTPNGMRLDFTAQGSEAESRCLGMFIERTRALAGVAEKITNSDVSASNSDSGVFLLQEKARELKARLGEAAYNNDFAEIERIRGELQRVTNEINEAQSGTNSIILSENERNILSQQLFERIASSNADNIGDTLKAIYEKAASALSETTEQIEELLGGASLENIDAYREELKEKEAKLKASEDKAAEAQRALAEKQGTLGRLATKYGAESEESESVLGAIDAAIEENNARRSEQSEIRSKWEGVMREFLEHLSGNAYKKDEAYNKTYLASCNVVGVSCTDGELGRPDIVYGSDFDIVIIDEVSKATPPELLIPLMHAKKAILVGDHRQLPPMFEEHEQSYKELLENADDIPESLSDLLNRENFVKYKKMVTSSLFKEFFERADQSIKHSLNVQFRMHSDIMNVINRFYENRLESGLSPEIENKTKNHGVYALGADGTTFIEPNKHAYWIDSSVLYSEKHPEGLMMYDSRANKNTADLGGTSVFNVFEKYLVIETLKKIADSLRGKKGEKKTVGVISFYQSQVNSINRAFKEEKKHFDFSPIEVEINTVDRFQGKEKNIIITSLVRNNRPGRAGEHVVAFERINVAFSRAQELLVIVGANHLYRNLSVALPKMDSEGTVTTKVYDTIINELHINGALVQSSALVTPELEEKILNEYNRGEE